MALHSVPTLGPAALSDLAEGPDVYIAECHHVQPAGDDCEAEHFRAMAVLVSVSADSADRMGLWPLRNVVAFARCTAIVGSEWSERLAERIATLQPVFATAVVFVGSDASEVAETVQKVIDTLHQLLGSTLALVVVASSSTEHFASLDGVSGFVRGVEVTNGETARQVFLALSTLIAPEALGGIDMIDLLPALGTAGFPSLIAEALWFREGGGSLVYHIGADKHAVANARRVVAVPFIRGLDWSELRRFHGAVRQDATACRSPIVFATDNALMPGLLPSNVGWVPIFCSSAPTAVV